MKGKPTSYRHGHNLRSRLTSLEHRIKKLARVDENNCWTWTKGVREDGYGLMQWKGRTRLVHRVVYEAMKGAIERGLEIDHLCRNRACCNPEHMEAVSRKENVARAVAARAHRKNGNKYAHNYSEG